MNANDLMKRKFTNLQMDSIQSIKSIFEFHRKFFISLILPKLEIDSS
jgi:hypothetical protein